MSSVLNKYATTIFAEHPIALWHLDDTCDYVSLLSLSDQDLNNWTTSTTVVDGSDYDTFGKYLQYAPPISQAVVNGISVTGGEASFTSNISVQESDIEYAHGSVAFGFYLCPYEKNVEVSFGYQYFDGVDTVSNLVTTSVMATTEWAFLSNTFDLPPEGFSDLEVVITVTYDVTTDPYKFAVNGITFGQLAENFQSKSLGVTPQDLPSSLGLISKGIESDNYGVNGNPGYYLTDGTTLFAKNSGMPIVYGASNSTIITKNDSEPSLIVPGFGFFNESKKYQEFTLEFWTRIQSNAVEDRRIVGPIGSDHGIYIDGPFLKLKLADEIGTYFVGEWDRPMLVSLRMTSVSASLVLNGEAVIILDIDIDQISLPGLLDGEGNDIDWIGFYAYDDVPKIELDCVSIFPYEVPAVVSKRRWVYGQAVTVPDNIEGINSASSVFIDYPFAEYAKNYSYPKIGRWENGALENIDATSKYLSAPKYDLPKFRFSNKTESEWHDDVSAIQDPESPSISLRPNSGWDDTDGHILFKNLNLLKEETKCFYGVFELTETATDEQILFELYDDIYSRSIVASITNDIVSYKLKYKLASGETQEDLLYSNIGVRVGDKFMAGIDIERFSAFYGKLASSFFGNKHQTKVYFAGNKEMSKTFTGNVHRIAFCNQKNFNTIAPLFTFFGLPTEYENVFDYYESSVSYDGGSTYFGEEINHWNLVLDGGDPYPFESETALVDKNEHIATYTLVGKIDLNEFVLDIEVESSWQDYIPLTYFGKYVKDAKGLDVFSLDFLQFNIDYPRLNNIVDGVYNTDGGFVKTYVSFQYLSSGANASSGSFANTEDLSYTNVISPGSNWLTTKYEVLNDTVIYMPQGVDFKKLAIVTHIEMTVPGVNKYPVKISSLQYASQALGHSATKIGTRFGKAVYPYQKVGAYYKYDTKNPFSIYKGSTPHLYLTASSGIGLRSEYTQKNERGISIPLNKSATSFYRLSSMQMAIRYDYDFPTVPIKLFEIQARDTLMGVFMVADPNNSERAQIYAVNMLTGIIDTTVAFFLNGRTVKKPFIVKNQWYYLGLTFFPVLDFDNYFGSMRVTAPILFNNLSFYQVRSEAILTEMLYRSWGSVLTDPLTAVGYTWDNWSNAGDWKNVLYFGETASQLAFNAESIYKIYTGTNATVFDTDYVFKFGNYRFTTYKDLNWSKQTVEAV